MSNCPKCNEKLSPFYMKQTCPKCNTNLVYYDLDKRLQADHEKAMREQEAVDKALNNIKSSAFGGAVQIIRFITFFTPLIWMCLPFFKSQNGTEITLISVIMGIINGEFNFGDKSCLLPLITMVCVIIFSLAVIISSLFSIGKKALKRNRALSILNYLILLICSVASFTSGASLGIGLIITIITYFIELLLHQAVDKKVNK